MYRNKRKNPALPNAICPNNSVFSAQQNDNATNDSSGATDRTAAATNTAHTDNDDDNGTNNGDAPADNHEDENDGDNSDTSIDEEASPSFPRWVRPADYRLRTTSTSRSKSAVLGYDTRKKQFGLKGVVERPIQTEGDLERGLADASAWLRALARGIEQRNKFKLQEAHTIMQINIKHQRKTHTGNVCLKESVFTVVHVSAHGTGAFMLKQVCAIRGANKAQVPYRNSTLTKLLQVCIDFVPFVCFVHVCMHPICVAVFDVDMTGYPLTTDYDHQLGAALPQRKPKVRQSP